MATFYGSDTTCLTDLPLIDTQITNPQVLIGQRIARRLQTPRGALALINDDPNFGFDVRQFINAKLTPGAIAVAQSQITAECLKDQQVYNAIVAMTQSGGSVAINIQLVSAVGPFTLTLTVGLLTAEMIFNP